jgi:hypothetical protein
MSRLSNKDRINILLKQLALDFVVNRISNAYVSSETYILGLEFRVDSLSKIPLEDQLYRQLSAVLEGSEIFKMQSKYRDDRIAKLETEIESLKQEKIKYITLSKLLKSATFNINLPDDIQTIIYGESTTDASDD